MIFPELYVPSCVNQKWSVTGLDSLESCLDQTHYLSYPHQFDYQYNSRGFRDSEWPADLSKVVWCVGDSFTVGIGVPRDHAWPSLLQERTGRRTINVSIDGASNNWIAKVGSAILKQFPSAVIVTHWSFLHRGELGVDAAREQKFQKFYMAVRDPAWPNCNSVDNIKDLPDYIQKEITQVHGWTNTIYGEDRRAHYVRATDQEDIVNTENCINQLQGTVVHSAIPNWSPPGLPVNFKNVILTEQLDYARDGFHYDIITSTALVNQIIPALALNAIGQFRSTSIA
jgi:hypothetical protein